MGGGTRGQLPERGLLGRDAVRHGQNLCNDIVVDHQHGNYSPRKAAIGGFNRIAGRAILQG